MKKIVSTFLLLFAVCGASAQLHVDLRVGASASMLSEQHLKLGLRGGVNIGYLFDEHFGLRTGLCYVMKRATTSSDVFDYASDRASRLSYIDLPVEATVGFRLSPTSRFDLHAGPYLSRLLRAKVPRTAPYTIRNWDTGICIGFDFIVGHFVIGPEVQYGLLRVNSSANDRIIDFSFTVGYRF